MKMRNGAGRGWNFAPAMADYPANKLAGAGVVAAVSPKRAKEQKHGVSEGKDLMLQRFARAEEVTANFPINFQDERRLRFVVGVICGEKIGEQFAIVKYWIDRVSQETGGAAKIADRGAIARFIATNRVLRRFVHSALFLIVQGNVLVNGKQTFEHPGPGKAFLGQTGSARAQPRQIARAGGLDRASERFRSVFLRPRFLVV